jgi:hypothetical protein
MRNNNLGSLTNSQELTQKTKNQRLHPKTPQLQIKEYSLKQTKQKNKTK